jgi:hypothetical protein
VTMTRKHLAASLFLFLMLALLSGCEGAEPMPQRVKATPIHNPVNIYSTICRTIYRTVCDTVHRTVRSPICRTVRSPSD